MFSLKVIEWQNKKMYVLTLQLLEEDKANGISQNRKCDENSWTEIIKSMEKNILQKPQNNGDNLLSNNNL